MHPCVFGLAGNMYLHPLMIGLAGNLPSYWRTHRKNLSVYSVIQIKSSIFAAATLESSQPQR